MNKLRFTCCVKVALFASLLLISTTGWCQLVVGTVIDGESKEPLVGALVIVQGTYNAVSTDTLGRFKIDLHGQEVLRFSFISFFDFRILGFNSELDTIQTGPIELINTGSTGYAWISKKRLLSKRKRYVCEGFDTRRKLKPEDLMVNCNDGHTRYVWKKGKRILFTLDTMIYATVQSKERYT